MKDIARPDIKPAFAERNVPVVFSTDENYLPYVSVALTSAIANSDGCNLDVIVMYSDIRDEVVQAFIARYIGSVNVSVRFVEISNGLSGTLLADFEQVDRLPLAACYRLLLPYILTAYDKVVYLDVDVAVCRSLAELYSVDLDDRYFAAVKDIVYSTKTEYVQWAASWDFTEWEGYVNTGVLVMNLARFRHSSVLNRLLKIAVEASKWLCDQDALNFVCKGEIASLDPRWNMQLGSFLVKNTKRQFLYNF